MTRVLILTAGYGEGHNSAARALHAAFAEQPGVTPELIDLFALHAPRFNQLSRRAYLRTINHAPAVWSGFYRWLDRSPSLPYLFKSLAGHRARLARLIAEKRPAAIVSTYPVYAWLLQDLRARGRLPCPHFTVVTDAITINSLWYRAPSDGWFVTDHDSAAHLIAAGVPRELVHVSGFPVALAFADRPAHLQPPHPAAGLPSHDPQPQVAAIQPDSFVDPRGGSSRGGQSPFRVLYMINSGRARALETARTLLLWKNWSITFTAGRDAALQRELQSLARGAPAHAEVLGWTDRIPELLMTHHVVISKAGGATTQESINALCPMLVNQIVPGQEEGNYELLRRHNAGALAETPAALAEAVHRASAHGATVWKQWRANLRNLARPAAARDIAARVLENCRAGSPDPAVVDLVR
ncbi:MAG: galactosyldiacylglycerol synthase [Opitutae bacterium]|nr:galactosyldiacylglycerol synthase [Opitutae bacterium]